MPAAAAGALALGTMAWGRKSEKRWRWTRWASLSGWLIRLLGPGLADTCTKRWSAEGAEAGGRQRSPPPLSPSPPYPPPSLSLSIPDSKKGPYSILQTAGPARLGPLRPCNCLALLLLQRQGISVRDGAGTIIPLLFLRRRLCRRRRRGPAGRPPCHRLRIERCAGVPQRTCVSVSLRHAIMATRTRTARQCACACALDFQ